MNNKLQELVISMSHKMRTLAEEVEATEDPVQDAEDNEEDTEEEMDMEHPLLMLSTSAIKMSTKKIMEEAGLHKKHSADSQLLQGFRSYLEKMYAKSGIKHEVVALREPKRTRVTAINYMSGVKIFFSYVTSEDQLLVEDPSLSGSISNFFKNITEVQKSICRGAGKEKYVGKTCTNPRECQEVLTLANSFFGEVIDRANSRNELQERDMTSMLFYLEALLILQHLQRPSVIQYMTVQQWLERTWYQSRSRDSVRAAVIKVKAATHPIVVFNEVEEMWFDTYFRFVRPAFMKRSSSGDKGYFFVSSKGSKIQNLTTDVHRFQERFNACLATGKEVLHIFEKVIICESTSEDQELIKIYLSSDFNKSNISEYMRATMRVSELQRTWEQPSNSSAFTDDDVAYKTVENAFKVDLDSQGPTLKECCKFTDMHGKYCFDRWRRQQTKCRLDAVIGSLPTLLQKVQSPKRASVNTEVSRALLLHLKATPGSLCGIPAAPPQKVQGPKKEMKPIVKVLPANPQPPKKEVRLGDNNQLLELWLIDMDMNITLVMGDCSGSGGGKQTK
eukprot:XP_017951180.1 PREDICTED: uncharacterized protein LOC108648099 [Xenopus tropicalis]